MRREPSAAAGLPLQLRSPLARPQVINYTSSLSRAVPRCPARGSRLGCKDLLRPGRRCADGHGKACPCVNLTSNCNQFTVTSQRVRTLILVRHGRDFAIAFSISCALYTVIPSPPPASPLTPEPLFCIWLYPICYKWVGKGWTRCTALEVGSGPPAPDLHMSPPDLCALASVL